MNKAPSIPLHHYPFWLLLKGLAALPLAVLYVVADMLYVLMYYGIRYRRKVVLQNLRNSFPEKSEAELQVIARDFYRQMADVLVEMLKMAGMSGEEMMRRARFTNPEVLENFVGQGKPVLILGSHAANWEWSLSAAALHFNFPAEGVYKPLSNAFFEKFMLHIRSRLGARLIKMKDTLRDFISKRKEPRVVALLSDQTPPFGEIHYWTTFLHQDTAFFVGAEKLSNMFGYPVLFLDVQRTRRGYYSLTFETITDGAQAAAASADAYPITEAFAQKLEAALQRSPADYLWTHKRWKHKKPQAKA